MDRDVIVRRACPDDCETIAGFNVQLALETERKYLEIATIKEGVRTILTEPRHGCYFVACIESRIVGQVMHTREWSDWRNGEFWWLQSVYVHPDHRRQGVFRELYRHLVQLAKRTPGVVGIRLYVEQHNATARQVYESIGFAATGYTVLEQRVDQNPPDKPV